VPIRALIFDFDGLILDTETPMRRSWEEIFGEHGLVVSDARWARLLGATADPPEAYEMLEAHLGTSIDRFALHARRMKRELQMLASEQVLPGVRALLADAHSSDLKLALASSSERSWVEGLLHQHGLLSSFDAIVCAEDVACTKPAPDLYLEALRRIGVSSFEAVALEDSEHGVAAARSAGIFVVAVPNRVTACLDFDLADLRIESLADCPLSDLIHAVLTRRHSSQDP
jgi:HAD superfamily hydrolase (TIGR01509 family)